MMIFIMKTIIAQGKMNHELALTALSILVLSHQKSYPLEYPLT